MLMSFLAVMQVNNGGSQLEALIQPLFDLCHLDNVSYEDCFSGKV